MTKSPKIIKNQKSLLGLNKFRIGNSNNTTSNSTNNQHSKIISNNSNNFKFKHLLKNNNNQNKKLSSQSTSTVRKSEPFLIPHTKISPKKRKSHPSTSKLNTNRISITKFNFQPAPQIQSTSASGSNNNNKRKSNPIELTSDSEDIINITNRRNRKGDDGVLDTSNDEQEEEEEEEESSSESSSDEDENNFTSDDDDGIESDIEIRNNLRTDVGYETVDPNYINKKLRQLKKGALVQNHLQEAQEIDLAFESCITRSKELFIGFLGGTITEELLKGFEDMESILSAGVRLYESKKTKHIEKVSVDSEKLEQSVLKLAELNTKFLLSKKTLSKKLISSREQMEKEIQSHKQNFEIQCQSLQKGKAGGGGGGKKGFTTTKGGVGKNKK